MVLIILLLKKITTFAPIFNLDCYAMNNYEKIGDFLLNAVLVIIGGGIFATVEKENLNTTVVYLVCSSVVIIFISIAFLMFRVNKKKQNK
jgi:uncharacterized membrane protein AbrB (regulator of aidB expression)